ncbi:MAG: hypothetical protein D6696_16345 [Acidobacteria bacterium]|nr:MAG: hypothetical protein D6696_16345 [Acidobacteriota bacterium]
MKPLQPPRAAALLAAVSLLVLGGGAAAQNDGPWLGEDGKPLPFAGAGELLDFLRTAPVVASKVLTDGINRPRKLTLERDGVRVHAIFRTVDKTYFRPDDRNRQIPDFRDRHVYEVAAYEVSRLLGIDNVPPATTRTIDGERGSIQLWIENARTEAERMTRRLSHRGGGPPWAAQQQTMLLFDNLIYNHDRNHGNMLEDETGKLWFIDHTRSFKPQPSLLRRGDAIERCERSLWRRLKALQPELVRSHLHPYLAKVEIDALLKRRNKLVRHLERLIAEQGEEQVLYDQGDRLAATAD